MVFFSVVFFSNENPLFQLLTYNHRDLINWYSLGNVHGRSRKVHALLDVLKLFFSYIKLYSEYTLLDAECSFVNIFLFICQCSGTEWSNKFNMREELSLLGSNLLEIKMKNALYGSTFDQYGDDLSRKLLNRNF